MESLEPTILSVAIGLGLSAACGFRIFLPLLTMSLASRAGFLSLAESLDWIASTPALVAFGTATVLEIGAYYIPFIDNLLDTVATPSAVVAGSLASASQLVDMNPLLGWSVAIIAGGGSAGLVQGLTTITRQVSSMATAGFGNPLISTLEAGASIGMTLLAIFVAPVAAFLVLVLIYFAIKRLFLSRTVAPVT